jgi:hypothetical protein
VAVVKRAGQLETCAERRAPIRMRLWAVSLISAIAAGLFGVRGDLDDEADVGRRQRSVAPRRPRCPRAGLANRRAVT